MVWYACYGSNLSFERFKEYLDKEDCPDHSNPVRSEGFFFPYDIYFAGSSSRWGRGKAFLDITKPGFSYGRMYLIKQEQYICI